MASLDGEDPLGGTEASFGSSSIAPDQETEFLDFPHISNYDIERRLGTGGMGAVWLAYDTRLGRKVALKLPRTEFAMDERRLHLFVREARAASALNHPNIITIYEAGESNGFHFVAMEFIEGVTVRRLMRDRSMPPKEAIRITRQIAAALEAAHRAGIIHRDMKPDNVMVRPDGLVKVLDFGAAYVETAPGGVGSKKNETILIGTPRYMSPEQARGKVVDSRSDIFSVGIMLYEMLAGQSPFPGNTQAEVFAALLEREPARLADEALDFVVRRALAKEPGDRYQSMDEFAAALDAVQGSVPITGVASAGTTPPAKTPPPDRSWRRRWRILTAAGVAAVAGLCLAGFYVAGLGGNWFHDSVPPETLPFTTFPGTKAFSSFSPDGNQIAFSWDGADSKAGGNRSIYVKLVGVGEPVRLTNDPAHDDSNPAWSPDGTHIAFQRGRFVMTIPVLPGGSERKIAESGPGFSWSPDGKSLALTSLPKPGKPTAILHMDLASGAQRPLTQPRLPNSDNSPVYSPDGRSVAFIRSLTSSAREVFIVPASGGTARQVTTDRRPIIGMTWTSDSREIVFSSVRTGGRALWRIPARGGTPRRIEAPTNNPSYPAISRQGTRLAYTDSWTDTNVYLSTGPGFANSGAPGKFREPVLLLSSTRDDHTPKISPDGKRIAFVSSRTGPEEIWVANVDGGGMVQLTHLDGPTTGSANWSPDGRWIAFDSRAAGSPDVFVIASEGGEPIRFTTADSFEVTPFFSQDGKWLYFVSDRNGGAGNIWRQRTENGHPLGEAIQVTRAGAFEGFEMPYGKSIVYSRGGGGKYGLWSVPVEGGAETPFHPRAGYWRSWGIVPQGLYFISKESTPLQTVVFRSFSTGQETALTTVPKDPLWYQPGLSISSDGRLMAFAQRDHAVADIMYVERFR